MRLAKNFNLLEFQSKDGAEMPQDVFLNIQKLANQLQVLRDYLCFPIYINSAYRSESHNEAVGGVKNSYHLLGMACDIKIHGVPPKVIYEAIEFLISEGSMLQGGLGLYENFVHYDFRGRRVRW